MLFDLQIFSGGVYPPSATSRTNLFFYFQLFLVLIYHLTEERHCFQKPFHTCTINFVRLLVSLAKREGAYALFLRLYQPPVLSARKTLLDLFILKANLTNSQQGFLVHRLQLLRKQKKKSPANLVFKSVEIRIIFRLFSPFLFTLLKWYNISKIVPKHFIFDKLSGKENCLKKALPGFKISL